MSDRFFLEFTVFFKLVKAFDYIKIRTVVVVCEV